MNNLTEDEVITMLYNCIQLPKDLHITNNDIVKFLKYEGELPDKYNLVKRELIMIRNNFRTLIKYLSHIYILKMVAIFLTYRLKGYTFSRKFISYLVRKFYGGFSDILSLTNYFIYIYMPE